jgi:hypothetical protein
LISATIAGTSSKLGQREYVNKNELSPLNGRFVRMPFGLALLHGDGLTLTADHETGVSVDTWGLVPIIIIS